MRIHAMTRGNNNTMPAAAEFTRHVKPEHPPPPHNARAETKQEQESN